MSMMEQSIPRLALPEGTNLHYADDTNEKMIMLDDINSNRIVYKPIYMEQGIVGAVTNCYMRETVGNLLVEASKLLPTGYKFMIYDAWRPFSVQNQIYYNFLDLYASSHPDLRKEDIEKAILQFVSKPTQDLEDSFVHGTGGSIDVTILDDQGKLLDMGTAFDSFQEEAATAYFEADGLNTTVRDNRRLLYRCMTRVGFTNLPSEWWHYDYGNKFWAYYTGDLIKYKGVVIDEEKFGRRTE